MIAAALSLWFLLIYHYTDTTSGASVNGVYPLSMSERDCALLKEEAEANMTLAPHPADLSYSCIQLGIIEDEV